MIGNAGNHPQGLSTYMQEAAKLAQDESYTYCPRCRERCIVKQGNKDGQCTKESCGFHFCRSCWKAYYSGHQCHFSRPKRHSKEDSIGSAKCKKFLGRL